MVANIGVTDAIKSLSDLPDRVGLHQTETDDFFPEWQVALSLLSDRDQASMAQIKRRCFHDGMSWDKLCRFYGDWERRSRKAYLNGDRVPMAALLTLL